MLVVNNSITYLGLPVYHAYHRRGIIRECVGTGFFVEFVHNDSVTFCRKHELYVELSGVSELEKARAAQKRIHVVKDGTQQPLPLVTFPEWGDTVLVELK